MPVPVKTVPVKTVPGIVFRPGKYPDKNIPEVTEADIEAIVKASNEPAQFDSEHGPSLFDGLLGSARNFRVGTDKGQKVVMADWDKPEPLAQLLGDTTCTVSAAFDDWNTRKITKVALTRFPRITDAQFSTMVNDAYVAFSIGHEVKPLTFAFYSNDERDVISADDFGDPENKLFPVRTQDEANEAMRQVWHAKDPTTVKNNIVAICERKKFQLSDYPYARPGVSVDIPARGDSYYFSTPPVHTTGGQPYNNSEPRQETNHMNQGTENKPVELTFAQKCKAFFGLSDEQATAMEATFNTATPEEIRLRAENAQLQQQLAAGNSTNFSAQKTQRDQIAESAAQKLLDENRIEPYQLEAVRADFSRALEDDAATPNKVTFSAKDANGQPAKVECSRFQSLQSLYTALPAVDVETEQVRELAPETVVLFSREASRQMNNPAADTTVDKEALDFYTQ